MKKFGLDFGTTNSCLCRYNEQRKAYEFIKFDNQKLDFFPTTIAFGVDGERVIGETARECQFDDDYDYYEQFKLSLGSAANTPDGHGRTPAAVMKSFLEVLIEKLRNGGYIGRDELPENMVMTVPDVWKNEEKNRIALDNLKDIYTELGFNAEDNVFFESEPVSAAAYYCSQICKDYAGYLVVVDFGGGTLDLTLCRVDENERKIYVLYRCGAGGTDGKGCAGNAFDSAVTNLIIEKRIADWKRFRKEDFTEGTPDFIALRNSFENLKISHSDEIQRKVRMYYRAYDSVFGMSYSNERVIKSQEYGLPKYELYASDIVEVFERVNAPMLHNALQQMMEVCRNQSIDTNSQSSFRVLLTGGFSNLYCVESEVRRVFGSDDEAMDRRFDEGFTINDRSTAIANGAAVIASRMITIASLCQMEIGFYYYEPGLEKECTVKLIERDKEVQAYREPYYFPLTFKVSALGKVSVLRLYFDGGNGRIPIRLDEPFYRMCPNLQVPDNQYQIGMAMGQMQIPILYIRDKDGNVWKESLNRIVERISLIRADSTEGGHEPV